MQEAYRYTILYFLLFGVLLLGSSFLLFEEKVGFSTHAILEYYLGNEEKFLIEKSWSTILKIILPHIFAFGLFFMVVLHFLIFTKYKKTKLFQVLIYAIFFTGFLELFSPYFIILGFDFFAYVKLFSFIALEFLLFYTFYLLFLAILKHLQTN